MASTTTNISLTKPAGTDQALISAINGNMDIIDTKMGAVGNTSVQSQITSLSDQIAMETLSSGTDLDTLSGYSYEKWFTGTNITQMTNYPSGIDASAFALQIIKLGNYYKQTLHALDTNRNIYERTQYYSGGVRWGSWSSFTEKITKTKTKSFTMDCTTALTQGIGYCGELAVASDIEGATFVIPQFARKSGYNYPLNVAYEGGALRLWSPASLTGVTVGVVLFFF